MVTLLLKSQVPSFLLQPLSQILNCSLMILLQKIIVEAAHDALIHVQLKLSCPIKQLMAVNAFPIIQLN